MKCKLKKKLFLLILNKSCLINFTIVGMATMKVESLRGEERRKRRGRERIEKIECKRIKPYIAPHVYFISS